ncbi:MAG TPA: PAS domain-containing protein [Opitutales bacterium]|nr:PAS domain-containing protein [Opitutales bacterium]
MSSTPSNPLPEHPRKLLLLSADPAEEALLSRHLDSENHGEHELKLVASLDELKSLELETSCHAILLDIRAGHDEALESIKWIGRLQSQVALICLCANHEQLNSFKPVIHLIDDYILADTLPHGELCIRISHAIRRRIQEYELLHEQDLLRSLMENIPDAIYFKDLESRFTKVNRAMARSYGHNVDSVIGRSDFDLFTEEHALPAYQDEQRIIETGQPIISKIEKETFADGHSKWVNSTKVPLRNHYGRIIGTMGISRDISDLKRVQDKLTEEHRLLTTILNNIPDRIFVKDREGRYIASNRLHLKFLGVTDEAQVLGTTLYDHFPKERAEKYFNQDMDIIRTGIGLINSEESRTMPNGRVIWYLTSKVPLIDETGKCVGIVGISRDVTTQKEDEDKLRKTIKVLNETQLQLIEAEKLKTVGRLAAGVAHEVKNPLNVVSLGIDYLCSKIDGSDELADIIQDMKQAVEKATRVISQLLDYSSPHEVAADPRDINAIIRDVLVMMRHNFNEAHIRVEPDLAENLPLVALDTQKTDQVFINLFLNAISAMKGGGVLHIRSYSQRMKSTGANVSGEMTELFKVGETMVTVEVTDTGHGIASEAADKLFDPFYSTKSTGGGTGLGLSVTRSIVEMHRGMITLENRKNTPGACATLYFPVSPDTHAPL